MERQPHTGLLLKEAGDGNRTIEKQIKKRIERVELTNCPPLSEDLIEDLRIINEARLVYQGLLLIRNPASLYFVSYPSIAKRQASQGVEVERLIRDYEWVKGSWIAETPFLPFPSPQEAKKIFSAAREPYERLLEHTQSVIGEILRQAQLSQEEADVFTQRTIPAAVKALKINDQDRFPQICRERLLYFLGKGSPSSDPEPSPPDRKSSRMGKIQIAIMRWVKEHPGSEFKPGDIARELKLKPEQVHRATAKLRKTGVIFPWDNRPTIEDRVLPLAQQKVPPDEIAQQLND